MLYSSIQLAFVTAINVDKEGAHVDIVVVPDCVPETARVCTQYAGNGFGDWCPLAVDDEVIVGAPSNDPNSGLAVIGRAYSIGDQPSARMQSHPSDRVIQVQKDNHLYMATSGSGTIYLVTADGMVLLGGEDATTMDAAMLGTKYRNAQKTFDATFKAAITTLNVAATGTLAAPPLTAVGAALAAFCNTMLGAINAFEPTPEAYLSKKVKLV